MESFLRRLQTVVDVDENEGVLSEDVEEELRDMPTDTRELQHRLANALHRLKTSSEQWEELRAESCKIEAELTTVRMKLGTSREQWFMVHQFDQATIDALVERVISQRCDTATTIDSRERATGTTDDNKGDPLYTQSLEEQIKTLRELISKYAEERDKYKLEFLKLQASIGEGQGKDKYLLEGILAVNREESWLIDRRALEERIEKLEEALLQQSEALSKLALQRDVGSEMLDVVKNGDESHFQRIQQRKRELTLWLRGKRDSADADADAAGTVTVAALAGSDKSSVQCVAELGTEASCDSPSPTVVKQGDVGETNKLGSGVSHGNCETLARKLEELRAENNAQEDALNSLYQDVHHLRERNGQLEQQVENMDEQLVQLNTELLMTKDQFRVEQERNEKLSEMLQCAQQKQEKLGRELAVANEAQRKLRFQVNDGLPALERTSLYVKLDNASSAASYTSVDCNETFNIGNTQKVRQSMFPAGRMFSNAEKGGLGDAYYGSFLTRWKSVFGRMMRTIGGRRLFMSIIAFSLILMIIVLQTTMMTTEADVVVSKMQADLIACQTELKLLQTGRQRN